MRSGQVGASQETNPGKQWLATFASLAVGTSFFALWFWLLPSWLGFRVDPMGVAPWRWIGAVPSVLGFAVALRCIWDFGWTGRGTPAPIAPRRGSWSWDSTDMFGTRCMWDSSRAGWAFGWSLGMRTCRLSPLRARPWRESPSSYNSTKNPHYENCSVRSMTNTARTSLGGYRECAHGPSDLTLPVTRLIGDWKGSSGCGELQCSAGVIRLRQISNF